MVMVCVDLEKAYDRVDREVLWQVLESYEVGGRPGRAVRSLYERCQACVRVLRQNSDWFGVEQGVRQGCVMSPWLFNLYMDNIVREARQKFVGEVQMEGKDSGETFRGKERDAPQNSYRNSAVSCTEALQKVFTCKILGYNLQSIVTKVHNLFSTPHKHSTCHNTATCYSWQ